MTDRPERETPTRLIALDDVAIGYSGPPFVESIRLEVSTGDYLGVVGPNGAGKSTLLKTMLGIIPAKKGRITRAPDLRIGYVPQRSRIDPIFPLSAVEMVMFGGLGAAPREHDGHSRHARHWFSTGARRADAIDALDAIGIRHTADIPYRDLSGGQQQRVLIARALVRTPGLLILDEPTQGMDLPSERALLDTIDDLNSRQMAVILVAHQLSLIAGRVRRVAFINKEKALFTEDAATDILTDEKLTDLYGAPMRTKRTPDGRVSVFAVAGSEAKA